MAAQPNTVLVKDPRRMCFWLKVNGVIATGIRITKVEVGIKETVNPDGSKLIQSADHFSLTATFRPQFIQFEEDELAN